MTTARNAEEIGRILLDENVRSVAHRYNNRINDGERNAGAIYAYRPFATPLAPVEFLKACKCLEFQSCETDDYETTVAYRIIRACIDSVARDLPGYESAPWEVTDNTIMIFSTRAKSLRLAHAEEVMNRKEIDVSSRELDTIIAALNSIMWVDLNGSTLNAAQIERLRERLITIRGQR